MREIILKTKHSPSCFAVMTYYHITYGWLDGWMHAWSIGLLLTDDNRKFPQYTHIFLLFRASKRKYA